MLLKLNDKNADILINILSSFNSNIEDNNNNNNSSSNNNSIVESINIEHFKACKEIGLNCMKDLVKILNQFNDKSNKSISLYELIQGSNIIFPNKKIVKEIVSIL